MTADPRLLVALVDLPGLDPVGLTARQFGPYLTTGQFEQVVHIVRLSGSGAPDQCDVVRTGAVYRCVSGLSVNLADAATRDRCLRWLAGRVGLDVGCGAPGFVFRSGQWWLLGVNGDQPFTVDGVHDAKLALAAVLRQVGGAS